jgi:1-acyl-sn-glycerol-3-phosphate acyltransferase
MPELSEEALRSFSKSVDLEGTGEPFRVPLLYRFLVGFLSPIVRTLFNVHMHGVERLPSSGPMILAGNHISNLDPIIKILAARRQVFYLAKEEHFQKQPNKFIMKSNGMIETYRESGGRDALARASDVLSAGYPVGVFPEGTRSRRENPPFLQPGKTGVARLSARFPDVPVFPICVIGTREVMPPGSNGVRFWKRVDVHIGNPIKFSQWLSLEDGGSFSEDEVASLLRVDEHGQRSIKKALFRKYTDQLMATLELMGAP